MVKDEWRMVKDEWRRVKDEWRRVKDEWRRGGCSWLLVIGDFHSLLGVVVLILIYKII
jgi:hypothetical protein